MTPLLQADRGSASPMKGNMLSRRTRGFTLIETMIVLTVFLIAGAISFTSLKPAFLQARVNNGYNITLMALRRGREAAVAERRTYIVGLDDTANPHKMTITQGSTAVVIATYTLPSDVVFDAEKGIPTSPTKAPTTPDGFGTGANAIDFDVNVGAGGAKSIYFYPDGSGHDALGNVNNGVVYIARKGDLYSSRAISVWGATGRVRGWRLYSDSVAGNSYWRQQ